MYTNINQLTPILQEYKDKLLQVVVNEDSIFIELDDEQSTTIIIGKESSNAYSICVSTFHSTTSKTITIMRNFTDVVPRVAAELQYY